MFIRQLYYLIALSREKHFARAAEACHVSQPTLSGGIQHLEDELGVAIVKRGQRFEGFTTEGERVLAWAQQILANWDGLKQDVRAMCGEPSGELRCGAIPTTLPIVSLLTKPCRIRYPGITHCILSLSSVEIIRRIEAFDLDVGISYLEHTKHDQLLEIPLYRERYVFIAQRTSSHASRETISWAEAAEIPLCLLTPNMQNRRIIDTAFNQAGVSPTIAVETDSILAMYSHVCHGGLASVVPHSFLILFKRHPGVVAIPLIPPFPARSACSRSSAIRNRRWCMHSEPWFNKSTCRRPSSS
ncbi:MAG: LysR substrate-binding domain-containing protein [Burkholderiales bacterium]